MTKIRIDPVTLGLDELGRVVLSDDTWCTNLSGCDATMNTFYCRNEVGGG